MGANRFPVALVSIVLATSLMIAGCNGDGLSGTYRTEGPGSSVLDFRGDKVTVTLVGESRTLDYRVNGDTITILNPDEGDLVLTRNSDGSINSPIGTFVKR